MKHFLSSIFVFIGLVIIAISLLVRSYNTLVSEEETIKKSWAMIDYIFQKQVDIIPTLLASLKENPQLKTEDRVLNELVTLRQQINDLNINLKIIDNDQDFGRFVQANEDLSKALDRLLKNPRMSGAEIKNNKNVDYLVEQIKMLLVQISEEKKIYNEAVEKFNATRRKIPSLLVAAFMGFPEKAYFKSVEAH